MTTRIYGALWSLAAGMLLYGCASSNHEAGLSLNANSTDSIVGDRRFGISSVLNRSPKVLIATPKSRKVSRNRSLLGALYAGVQDGRDRENGTSKSVVHGQEAEGRTGINTLLSGVGAEDRKAEGSESSGVQEEIILPVVSIAYRSPETVVKAVNGGFGMVLLRQGDRKNRLVCFSLFNSYQERNNRQIEIAARNGNKILRPTYWLDKRMNRNSGSGKKRDDLLHLTRDKKLIPPISSKVTRKSQLFCDDKVSNYDYDVSQDLVTRLGLQNKPGPFLAAWRQDGRKAMVLDLSLFHTQADFDLAITVWEDLIIRSRTLFSNGKEWKPGIINSVSNPGGRGPKGVALLLKKGASFSTASPQKEKLIN